MEVNKRQWIAAQEISGEPALWVGFAPCVPHASGQAEAFEQRQNTTFQ
jgi:hypothetical protein